MLSQLSGGLPVTEAADWPSRPMGSSHERALVANTTLEAALIFIGSDSLMLEANAISKTVEW